MQRLFFFMLIFSWSAFAQVNLKDNNIICSGAEGRSGNRNYKFSTIFKGPSWGDDFGHDDGSLEVINSKQSATMVVYQVKDLDGSLCRFSIQTTTGSATLSPDCLSKVSKFRCVSFSSNSTNLDLMEQLKKYGLPYEVCSTVRDSTGPYEECGLGK